MGGATKRNLLEILNLGDEAFYASMIAWLLEPGGEHGAGDRVLKRLEGFLEQRGVTWSASTSACTDLRLGPGGHEIVLTNENGDWLVLVHRFHPVTDWREVERFEEVGNAIGLGLNRGSFLPRVAKDYPVWTYAEVLKALEGITAVDGYALLVVHFREHLRERLAAVNAAAGLRRPSARRSPSSVGGSTSTADSLPQGKMRRRDPSTETGVREASDVGSSAGPPSTEVLDRLLANVPTGDETFPDEPELDLSEEMVPSEDMSRVYTVKRQLGSGGQGFVFEVEVQGEQSFPDFLRPVTVAVMKVARPKSHDALRSEQAIYEKPNRGLVKLLDAGETNEAPYLVLERLHPHPGQWFPGTRVDTATAIDIFVNMLEILQGLHFNRDLSLVLGDIKPDNIMLRMSNSQGAIGDEEYLRRIATGAYEPVFMDMGCAVGRQSLEQAEGRQQTFIGTPLYLPPESIPTLTDGNYVDGRYSVKTDVYGLTLSFYEMLSGRAAYSHRGLDKLKGKDRLVELFTFKRDRVRPYDPKAVGKGVPKDVARDLIEVLDAGLAPKPNERASSSALYQLCKRLFQITERRPKEVGEYHFDAVKGLRIWQNRFERIDPEHSPYTKASART